MPAWPQPWTCIRVHAIHAVWLHSHGGHQVAVVGHSRSQQPRMQLAIVGCLFYRPWLLVWRCCAAGKCYTLINPSPPIPVQAYSGVLTGALRRNTLCSLNIPAQASVTPCVVQQRHGALEGVAHDVKIVLHVFNSLRKERYQPFLCRGRPPSPATYQGEWSAVATWAATMI